MYHLYIMSVEMVIRKRRISLDIVKSTVMAMMLMARNRMRLSIILITILFINNSFNYNIKLCLII